MAKGKRQTARLGVVVATLVAIAPPAFAQPAAQPQNVEVDPVQCWWRTSVTSVRVGEPFSIILTCSALETDAASAVIDRSRLGSAAVQFPPFEVTGGTQSADHVTAGRRFMQYDYTTRLISEDAFGSDVPIPAMAITYRIESRVQQDSSIQGREQTYELPALTMRVNSLVAGNASHIREGAVPSLDAIANRAFRARMFRLVALILFGVAGLTLLLAGLRWYRAKRKGELVAASHFLAHRSVLAAVRRELSAVQQTTRGGGWTPELLARALAAARVVASYVVGSPVTQRESATATDGELRAGGGFVGRRVAVSGTTTAETLKSRAAAGDFDDALGVMTAARYGRADTYDGSALDDALASTMRAADRVASQHTYLADAIGSLRQTARTLRPRAWAR
jgi:hypothetical protein